MPDEKKGLRRPKGRLTVKIVEEALRNSAGIQSIAAEKLGVTRSTICRFVAKHDRIRLLIEEITDEMNDVAEAQLSLAIKRGDPWAVKYWLENRGQSRGYGRRKMAFRDGEGNVQVPATLVTNGRMTEEEWANTDWAAASAAAPSDATIN